NFTDEIYELFEAEREGFELRQALGLFSNSDAVVIQHHIDNLIKFGKKYDLEIQIQTKKGNPKWIRTVGCAEWQNKRISHVYGIVQDISEQKEKDLVLQESERKFNAAFELAPIGMGLVSPQGKWIKINRALSNFFEFPPESIKKIPSGNVSLNEDLIKALKSVKNPKRIKQDIYQLENEYVTNKGKVKWGRLNINSVKDEQG